MWKRYSSYEGGTADPMIVSWPAGILPEASCATQYSHAIDVVPTLLECLGVELPDAVRGVTQHPIEGTSFVASFADAKADTGKQTQFYSMLGTRGIWHNGWKAATVTPAAPNAWGDFAQQRWELFDTANDPDGVLTTSPTSIPDRLQELIADVVERGRQVPSLATRVA